MTTFIDATPGRWGQEGGVASMAAWPNSEEGQPDPDLLLLAEDNPVNAKVALAMLESAGYRVVIAVNGDEAVAALAAGRYAAVLMDCQMPRMDGYEATAVIRSREHGGPHTPIIAMTSGTEDKPRCLSVGMDDYLSKPVQRDRLLSTVARWTGPGSSTSRSLPVVPTLAADEILDPYTVAHLRSLGDEPGSEGLLDELFQLFFKEMTSRLADLHAAVRRNDSHSVAFTAHTIKGSAAELGARRLEVTCSDLVSMGVAGRLEGAGQMVREVEVEYELARSALLGQSSPVDLEVL